MVLNTEGRVVYAKAKNKIERAHANGVKTSGVPLKASTRYRVVVPFDGKHVAAEFTVDAYTKSEARAEVKRALARKSLTPATTFTVVH